MKGMIVYSFAWRTEGHSPCNIRLAEAAKRIDAMDTEPIMIFAQRTTARALKELGISCHIVQKVPGYEGSEEVTRQAAELFRKHGIVEVIPVAQPVLQLTKCILLIRKEGFITQPFQHLAGQIGWIGFDACSVQPATRDPIRLVLYTVCQTLFGYRPPIEKSEP